jgi:Pyruvate/2-oxoacid:ferredoxin oxidoreductase delta subunit
MNWTTCFLGNIYSQFSPSVVGSIEAPLTPLGMYLLWGFIISMMVIGFFLLYLIFRRDTISSRFIFIIFALILVMSVITILIAYLFFWADNPFLAFPILVAAMLFFFVAALTLFLLIETGTLSHLPLFSKGVIHDWRARYRYTIPVVVALIFWELAMGFLYGSAFLPHDSSPFLLAVNNVDFALMMIVDAIFFLLISRNRGKLAEAALFTFALAMALMPNFFIHLGNLPVLVSMLLSAFVMVINVVLLYILQMRSNTFNFQALVLVLAACDLLSMVGLALYAAYQSLMFISGAMVISMGAYFFLVTHRLPSRPVSSYRTYSFLLLVLINAAELTMSLGLTSLGFSITNSVYPQSTSQASYLSGMQLAMPLNFNNPLWWLFPFDPIKMTTMAFHSGLSISTYFAPLYSSFLLVMMTTMSPFYAIMMGAEMSYLVLERARRARNASVKSWALTILAGIPLFVILVPFYTPLYIFGMSGMLFSVSLPLFVISIVAIIGASVVFGRRAQCNLVCMAAHMWTNVYYDQFKPKDDHPFAWSILRWISFFIMILSFGAFVLEETGMLPPIMIGSITINPLNIYGMFVLNYVWWYFYFLTPAFGAYSCARQGWCGFGTLSGIFNRFFFKIKVTDRNVCKRCETRQCESSCPTAIPLRADFLAKGSSSRITCIGCGDCVEACPQENLRIVDARDYIRRRPLTI